MNLEERIDTFVKFAVFLSGLKDKNPIFMLEELEVLKIKIKESEQKNNWFTRENILSSLITLSEQLRIENFDAWLTPYNLSDTGENKKVLLVMAGNIPLVGFHDFLTVLISGHKVVVKMSSADNVLLKVIIEKLISIAPGFKDSVSFIDGVI